ncbi:AAA family ATPase [Streptomyces sp. H27-C3]|uniref:AAA family ATPase n=1 Tax=Streptomyces sp. H27-C3 TaxID=3046305 RepID=UPI0024B963CD|nr:AAA family ATPase [Streptomyces sp. H27-C3]MDJ0464961.1 AAA family ATPase [Streptomyces sp. H27-C3]
MSDQDLPRVVPNARGGDEKTTAEIDLSALLADDPRQRVLLVDMDPQPSAEGWTDPYQPVIIDLPGTLR